MKNLIKNKKALFIDLDGTMVNSVPDLEIAVNNTMLALKKNTYSQQKISYWVGNGIEKLIKRALTNSMDGEPKLDEFNIALEVFKYEYEFSNGKYSNLYPGVLAMFEYVKKLPIKIICITNKAEQFSLPLLKQHNILDKFDLIISGDTCNEKKPSPVPLVYGLDKFKILAKDAIHLGDSKNDVEAARAAGIEVACVTYGYNHNQDIATYNPDFIIDNLDRIF